LLSLEANESSSHSIDAVTFEGKHLSYSIEGEDINLTRLSDGAYDVNFNFVDKMIMDKGAEEVNYYCVSNYDKESDSFAVSITDEAGTKVVKSFTIEFEAADNLIGYTWKIVKRDSSDDDFTLYQAFLEEHTEITDLWLKSHIVAQTASYYNELSTVTLDSINREFSRWTTRANDQDYDIKVKHIGANWGDSDAWLTKIDGEEYRERNYVFLAENEEGFNAYVVDRAHEYDSVDVTFSFTDSSQFAVDGAALDATKSDGNDANEAAVNLFLKNVEAGDVDSDVSIFGAAALLFDSETNFER